MTSKSKEGLYILVGELTTKALEQATELIKVPRTQNIAERFVKFASEITGFNQETLDYSDFKEPQIQVWDNITFADNYYQTTNTGSNPINLTPNGRELVNTNLFPYSNSADLNLDLTEFRGFKGIEAVLDNPIGGAHSKVLAWYAGTVDQALERIDNEFLYEQDGVEIQNQQGEVNVENWYYSELDPSAPLWYSSSTIPDEYDPEEGIGTGWYYSYLNGGERKFDNPERSTVTTAFDNTSESRSRGDFAVPTLFNGNFDASFSGNSESVTNNGVRNVWGGAIPGWSYHNGRPDQFDPNGAGDLKYGINIENLVDWKNIDNLSNEYLEQVGYDEEQPNFALRMDGGDSIVHNRFVVPEWGSLRFDVHVPEVSDPNDQSNNIKVFLGDEELKSFAGPILPPDQLIDPNEQNNLNCPAVDLREVSKAAFDAELMQGQTNRIGYGKKGFQTFHVDIPENLRGKVSTLRFEIAGEKTVFIDNVAFKSVHLNFGNPELNGKEARQDTTFFADNYLVEKPQFSLSYNDSLKTPNWVGYQLNKTWLGDEDRYELDFVEDLRLPFSKNLKHQDLTGTGYQRGHMTANADRNRNNQDQWTTYSI